MGVGRIALWKKCLFAALICGSFFLLLEVILWAAGVPTLIEREDPFRGFSGLVSVFEREGSVYRTRRAVAGGTFNDQSFLVDKPAGGPRIFCLGGSSAYGYPWGADVAFTSIVGEALAASHSERHVEAVNAAGVSYAMHRMNLVAEELLAYKPDVFLIYEGHNEFIEPAFFESLKSRSATRNRLDHAMSHLRLYSGLTLMKRRLQEQPPSSANLRDLVVRRDQTRVFSPPEKEAIVAQFRQGLERLVRRAQEAGVKVVLSTVPCNLRDWRPEASAGVMSLSEPDRKRWSKSFASGQRRLEDSAFAPAVADLEPAARLAPHHAETQFLLAKAYEGLGRFSEARAAYQRACDEDASPIRRVSGINAAIRDVAQRNNVLLVDMDQIFEKQSEHGLTGNNLIEDYVHPTPEGHQLIAWHMWDAMERAGWFGAKGPAQRALFDRMLAERSSRVQMRNPAWFQNQGVILWKQGHVEAAIKSFRQALLGDPNLTPSLLNLGGALVETGQFNEAVEVSERLVVLSPDLAEAHYNWGNALNQLGRPQEAIDRYQEALRIKPDFAMAHYNWGNALNQLGRPQEAIHRYQEALRIQPDVALAHYNLAKALQSVNRIDEALQQYNEALRLKPGFFEAHINLANALMSLRRNDEAMAHYHEAVQLKSESPEVHFNFACALQSLGKLDEAMEHYGEAIRLNPNDYEAHINLGSVLHGLGKFDEAITHYREAIRLKPDYHITHGNLAVAYAEVGDFERAVEEQSLALSLAPEPQKADYQSRLELYKSGKPFRPTQAK